MQGHGVAEETVLVEKPDSLVALLRQHGWDDGMGLAVPHRPLLRLTQVVDDVVQLRVAAHNGVASLVHPGGGETQAVDAGMSITATHAIPGHPLLVITLNLQLGEMPLKQLSILLIAQPSQIQRGDRSKHHIQLFSSQTASLSLWVCLDALNTLFPLGHL